MKKRRPFFLCLGTAVESHAAIFTTEISQVPLEGVIALLKIARLNHV